MRLLQHHLHRLFAQSLPLLFLPLMLPALPLLLLFQSSLMLLWPWLHLLSSYSLDLPPHLNQP